jgi:4-amino-4-deoxy-L-arabinose transferase-like glycosyltransferase
MSVTDERPIAPPTSSSPSAHPERPPWWTRLVRGRQTDPPWVRPALLVLLSLTAVLWLWGLGASGWANSFYSAAVQAGSKSWKAAFFGSFDSSNFITVDKPPASLWVMDASARIFGVNAWSILVPQALEGVAAVAVLYAAVRRRFSPAAALLAGAVMALTPVATLMFRYNSPDALLVLLLVCAAYAMIRAVETAQTRWLALAGALIGLGFMTKMLQALLVVPVFALVYLIAAPTPLPRRIRQLLIGGVGLVVSAGWWVAVVTLIPATARPYIGGSQTNSVLNLIFSYNGFGRLTGNEVGSVGGAAGGTGRWGATGLTRLFGSEMGGQISWLLPAALILLVALLWVSRRAPRTDQRRAAVMLWGGWLLVTGATFSYAQGIIHPYYTVALAPAVAALVGIGATALWRRRDTLFARAVLAVALATTAAWAFVLLDRTPSWFPGLRVVILIAGLGAAATIMVGARLVRRAAFALACVGVVASIAGPAAYSLQTAATPHAGAIPSAGPVSTAGFPGGRPPGLAPGGGAGTGPRAGFGGGFAMGGGPAGGIAGANGGPGGQPGGAGGPGGLLGSTTPSTTMVRLLQEHSAAYKWVAATAGSDNAAGYQLATGDPVMAIGGFNGTDPAPTLAQFQQLVSQGKIHYFIAGGGFGAGGGAGGAGAGGRGGTVSSSTSTTASAITSWVEQHFSTSTVGGTTVYDLTAPTGG